MGESFCSWWNSSRLSLQREVAIVLFIAIAPNTFLRGVPITPSMISSALDGRRGFVWCEFLTVGATPSTASCELAWIASSRHIYGPPRVDPYGRDLELPEATRIEQPLTNLSLCCICCVSPMVVSGSWSSPSAVALASARHPARGSMRGQRREGRPLCRAGAEVLRRPVGSGGR